LLSLAKLREGWGIDTRLDEVAITEQFSRGRVLSGALAAESLKRGKSL